MTASAYRAALDRLCTDLALPREYGQDWAHELPEEFRSAAHLERYVAAYENPSYDEHERRLLVELALDVTNDLFQAEDPSAPRAWSRLADLFRRFPDRHREEVEYWALAGEPLEDAFPLTPWVRRLLDELPPRAGA